MGPQLPLSTYSQEFGYPIQTKPSRPRPSSAHRRNNPHPRPDFLLPRKLQTGYGRRQFLTSESPSNIPLLPPVKHISLQCPDGKTSQPKSAHKPSQTHSNTTLGSPVTALPPAGWTLKSQPDSATTNWQSQDSMKNLQRPIDSASPSGKYTDNLPPLRPFKSTYYKSRSKSTPDSSGGYSCFHVLKPYKAGHYIIHPEFTSEWLH